MILGDGVIGTAHRNEQGFSLLEVLIASFVGLLAMVGILFLYKAQHKNMVIQGSIADMRMNGQYALNELQFYLVHAGLGLPSNLRNISISNGDLVVRSNSTKKSVPATMDPSSSTTRTVYRIPSADTTLFDGKAFAAALVGAAALEAEIGGVVPRPGVPTEALITLMRTRDDFSSSTLLYPMDRVRLHRCTGIGADTAQAEFKVVVENPGHRSGIRMDTLALAEGIESISYRWLMLNRDSLKVLPTNLDSLQRIEIKVTAKTLVQDRAIPGDGYRRQTLSAKVNYRRSL